jgi:adenine phosphoribosyltransferase
MSTMSLQDLVASFSWVDGHANIWPWFANADLFAAMVEGLARPFEGDRVTRVVGIEARAFLLAGAVARRLNAGLSRSGNAAHSSRVSLSRRRPRPAIAVGRPIFFSRTACCPDPNASSSSTDRLETGSQVKGAVSLVREAGAHVAGVGVIVDDSDPTVDLQLPKLHSLIRAELLGPSR